MPRGSNKRKSLAAHVLDNSFRPSVHGDRLLESLPPVAPADPTKPLLAEVWPRLLELQAAYPLAVIDRERQAISKEFWDRIQDVHRQARPAESLAEFVTSQIGPHPRLGAVVSGGERFARFCSEFLVHTKGRWQGEPFVLGDWQMPMAEGMFGVDPDTGLRLHAEAYVQLAKKTGKSTMASGVEGYLAWADDEPGAEVFGGASDKDQARIVFAQLKDMAEKSRLSPWLRFYRDAIEAPSIGSVLKILAADALSDEGVNLSGGVIDEYEHHKSSALYDLFIRSGEAREQPFVLVITNAPADEDPDSSPCADLRSKALAVLNSEPDARTDLYANVIEVPADRLDDRDAWMVANPAPWITEERLEQARRKMRYVDFVRYRLNHPIASDGSWLPPGAWDACQGSPTFDPELPHIVGVDFASKKDTASVVLSRFVLDADGGVVELHTRARVFALDRPGRKPPAHEYLTGDRIPLSAVKDAIREACREVNVAAVGYDPWRFQDEAVEELESEGIVMIEVPQTNERMCPAAEELLDAIVEGKLVHGGDAVYRRHILNARAREVSGRGWRLDKAVTATQRRIEGGTRPMDAAQALVNTISVRRATPKPTVPMVTWG
jgi:phage terminase large subunit-like protein